MKSKILIVLEMNGKKIKEPISISEVPIHKRIGKFSITVDCFYIPIKDCDYYLLSHFHADHYMGLTSKFIHPIYCSETTASLVSLNFGCKVVPLQMYKNYSFDYFILRLVEANHCPGAVMFIFLIEGVFYLHTGDFRFNKIYHSFNLSFKSVYLDNTYEDYRNFGSQKETINKIIARFDQKGLLCPLKISVICATYCIGKEKIFFAVAEYLDSKIQVSEEKMRIYKSYGKYTIDKINRDVREIINNKRAKNNCFGFTASPPIKYFKILNENKRFIKKSAKLAKTMELPAIETENSEFVDMLDAVIPLSDYYNGEPIFSDKNIFSELTDLSEDIRVSCSAKSMIEEKQANKEQKNLKQFFFKNTNAKDEQTNVFDRLTTDEAQVKVVGFHQLKNLDKIASEILADRIIVLVGSGWNDKVEYKNYKRPDNKIIKKGIEIVYFQYSEHSSSEELEKFKESINCKNIIRTVIKN